MRLRSICVYIDFDPVRPGYLRARVFQWRGKTEKVWGRKLGHPPTLVPHDCRIAIEKEFSGKVHSVWISYAPKLGLADEMMKLDV